MFLISATVAIFFMSRSSHIFLTCLTTGKKKRKEKERSHGPCWTSRSANHRLVQGTAQEGTGKNVLDIETVLQAVIVTVPTMIDLQIANAMREVGVRLHPIPEAEEGDYSTLGQLDYVNKNCCSEIWFTQVLSRTYQFADKFTASLLIIINFSDVPHNL